MTLLTDAQLVSVARTGGFSEGRGYQGHGLTWAVAVALAESAGRTDATGYNAGPPASKDRGLWQINDYYHPEYSEGTCYDAYGCAAAAYQISSQGSDWTPWATFNNGSAGDLYARAATAVAGQPYSGSLVTSSSPALSTAQTNAPAIIQAALDFARAQLGEPYVYGATGPDSWDCSGLTQACYAAGGLTLPRTAAQQYAATPQVDVNRPQPGDLAFQYMGADDRQDHVGIYEGDGQMILAPHTGDVVKRQAYSVFPGRALTRPTNVTLPTDFAISGCSPLPATLVPQTAVLAFAAQGPFAVRPKVHFLPPPIGVIGGRQQGALRACSARTVSF